MSINNQNLKFTDFVHTSEELPSDLSSIDFIPVVRGVHTYKIKGSDIAVAGSGIEDVPDDGKIYVRRYGAWEELVIG